MKKLLRWSRSALVFALVALASTGLVSIEARAAGGESIAVPDSVGNVGLFTSMKLDQQGRPVIAYRDHTSEDLKVLRCGNATCTEANTITAPDTTGSVGWDPSLTLDANDFPIVSYHDNTTLALKVLRCGNPTCTAANTVTTVDAAGTVGFDSSIALDGNGFPVVSYFDSTNGDLKIVRCEDPACASSKTFARPATQGTTGLDTSLVLDANDFPIVAYYDFSAGDLNILWCGNKACTGGNSIIAPDTAGDDGVEPSLVLDTNGRVVVSYYDSTAGVLKVLRCNDVPCTRYSIEVPDNRGDVGSDSSLALDADGFPVVSYYDYDRGVLKLLHCGDTACASGNRVTSPDTNANTGNFTSLALDANGYPVVSYYDTTNGNLNVLHCNDPFCSIPPVCDGQTATFDMSSNGGNGTGSPGPDVIADSTAVDTIDARAGNDSVCAHSNDLSVFGGAHDDRIFIEATAATSSGQRFSGDGGASAPAGNDRLVVRAGSVIDGIVSGDDVTSGSGGDDTILFAGFLTGSIRGDDVPGDGGTDFIAVLPAGDVEHVIGDSSSANGAKDTITIVGKAAGVRGDGANGTGGNDVIAITNGARVIVRDATDTLQGWVIGDLSVGKGGNDFMIIRGRIALGVIGDYTSASGGKDFMRIYPAAVINGPVIGDGGAPQFDGSVNRAPGAGGDDTVVAFAGATINSSVLGDVVKLRGGNDRFSLGATIAGSVIGDSSGGDGGNDSIGIGGAGTVNGSLVGDDAGGRGGNDILDVSGTIKGSIVGDIATGDGGNDIIFIRAIARVGPIVGDSVGGQGGDDVIAINKGAVVNGPITGDVSTGRGGNDTITVSGTVHGAIVADDGTGLGGNDRININPAGVVNGNIIATKGTNTIVVRGTVNGSITCSPTSTLQILGGTVTGDTSSC